MVNLNGTLPIYLAPRDGKTRVDLFADLGRMMDAVFIDGMWKQFDGGNYDALFWSEDEPKYAPTHFRYVYQADAANIVQQIFTGSIVQPEQVAA